MHEMSIMAQVFTIIEQQIRKHNFKQVTKVVLKIGELTCIEESALEFAFAAFAQDTKVEGADLIIDKVEAVAQCAKCGVEFKANFTNKVCPRCNEFTNNLVAGDELLLAQLEGE